METPFFSILVPVYNSSAYMDECLRSLVNQTYTDFEIILLDDGSTDDSGSRCDEWAEKDRRIRVIHRENRGTMTTRLDEMDAARGEYVVSVDSDDYVREDLLAFLKERIDAYGCDVVTYGRYIDDNQGTKRRIELRVYPDGTVFGADQRHVVLSRLFLNNDLTSIWSKCVKRTMLQELLPELRAYEGVNNGEDWVLSAAIFSRFTKLMYTDEGLYFYRCNGQGISNVVKVQYFPDTLVCRRALKHFVESCECKQKATVVKRFWSREWYVSLYLLKEYLRLDVEKECYRDVYRKMKQSIKEYKTCSLKYRMAFMVFHPVFYIPVKWAVKKVWPR